MKKEEKVILGYFGQVRAILGKFRQVWASLGKLGQGKWKRKAERIRKGNKNLSGEGGGGEEEGGETRI